jgi:hypothetical protein
MGVTLTREYFKVKKIYYFVVFMYEISTNFHFSVFSVISHSVHLSTSLDSHGRILKLVGNSRAFILGIKYTFESSEFFFSRFERNKGRLIPYEHRHDVHVIMFTSLSDASDGVDFD